MNNTFSLTLSTLRKAANLTNKQLAEKSGVPRSFIAGLQSGKRRIGELQARKIGTALGLEGEHLEQFVLQAIDTCTEKVLMKGRDYPAEFINLITRLLSRAGIPASSIFGYSIKGDQHEQDVTLLLDSGNRATLTTHLTYA